MICGFIFFAAILAAIVMVKAVEMLLKFVFAHEIWAEEKEERYDKYRSMFEEMKKG